jgi:mannitol-specific phosphotransferase system IIBC component
MEAFWGVIVGAIISFVGVLLTLRWNQRVHEDNLREENRKTKEEREFSAKQDVLLAASDAVTRFITYYLSLADRTLPSDGVAADEAIEIGIAMNRLHFYCSIETIEKATHLGQVLSDALTEAITAKMPSAFINEDIKTLDVQISGLEKMNAALQEEVNAILQCEPTNPLIISHRNLLAQNFQTIADLHGKRVELIKQKYIETEKCRDVIKQNLKNIYDALKDVLLFARQELSFSIDQERYKTLITEQTESTIRNLDKFLAEIRKQVLAKMQ